MTHLEPLAPEEALDWYLDDKQSESAASTMYSHTSRLGHFIRWCDAHGIDNLNALTGRDLQRYKVWRRDEGDLNSVTVKTQMDTLRVFIRWCEQMDAIEPDLSTKVQSPTLADGENARDVLLNGTEAEAVLDYLETYEYASAPHVTLALLWQTSMRRGAVRALDIEDYDPEAALLDVRHRPEKGTPIKNKQAGERMVALSPTLCDLLDAWIADRRPDVTDDHGRDPLIATTQGRPHGQTIQRWAYEFTRPCTYTNRCPADRDPKVCEAAQTPGAASQCPESVSPHAIRRGSITHWLQHDVPMQVVSDRANVSPTVLEQHYDRRTKRERAEQRRDYLDQV